MKLITLNIWGGHVLGPLLKFINAHQDIDIFCFQEVYHNAERRISTDVENPVFLDIFSKLQAHLPQHRGFFTPVVNGSYGICAFVKKTTQVVREGEELIHENPHYKGSGPTHSRKLQWLQCRAEGDFLIINVHGLWNGQGKTDAPERLLQSQKIKAFMDTFSLPKILVGDFNLRPETQSMKILGVGMDNWIQVHKTASTRTRLYTKEEPYADYILTSGVTVDDFQVMPHVVSDHAPLLLDFNVHVLDTVM
ncbi:MAG: endonuclease/exonuclease/phosphatase family protein [Verrucomicrobia bacterium]|nr:endonuclease/exonuclease/phosphatase family protein [Verrucomicrobiota bacterium]